MSVPSPAQPYAVRRSARLVALARRCSAGSRRVAGRVAGAAVAGVTLAGLATALAPAAAAHASSIGSRAVAIAAEQQGDPYVYGAAGPSAFDCSGLVRYVYGRLGIDLPHNSAAQYGATRHVSRGAMALGDIVFFYDASGHIYHDGIYAGGGRMWVAPHTGTSVQLQSVAGRPYLVGRPYGSSESSGSGRSGGSGSGSGRSASGAGYRVGGGHPLLRIGAHGPAVARAQRLLGVGADGEFGPRTRAATIRFQRGHHLLADGEIGRRTWAALDAGHSAQPAVYRVTGHPVLRIGASGPAVRIVQRAVRVPVDGQFGPTTRGAVKRFQARHGLTADGVVGPRTWNAIRVVLT